MDKCNFGSITRIFLPKVPFSHDGTRSCTNICTCCTTAFMINWKFIYEVVPTLEVVFSPILRFLEDYVAIFMGLLRGLYLINRWK